MLEESYVGIPSKTNIKLCCFGIILAEKKYKRHETKICILGVTLVKIRNNNNSIVIRLFGFMPIWGRRINY